MIALIGNALALASETADYPAFRAAYHQRFRRAIACDSRETVPATLALLQLAAGDPYRTLCYAANFGRAWVGLVGLLVVTRSALDIVLIQRLLENP